MHTAKGLVILYWGSQDKNLVFAEKDAGYRKCYEFLTRLGKEKNLDIFFSSLAFWNGKKFLNVIHFDGKKWATRKNISPDLVYDKIATTFSNISRKKALARRTPVLNPIAFDPLCNNKFTNYLIFEDFYPRSFLVTDKKELKGKLKQIRTKKFVLKPNVGTGGKRVAILPKHTRNSPDFKNGYFLLQEFINSSGGIKGLTDGTHDLRVTIVNDKIAYAYIRTPRKGSLICNISQGGKMKNIARYEIPKKIEYICKKVIKKLGAFDNLVYAVDFAMDKDNQPKIIEMNSRPGVYFYPQDKADQKRYYSLLLNNFLDCIRKNSKAGS